MLQFYAFFYGLVERDLQWLLDTLRPLEKGGHGGAALPPEISADILGKTRLLPSSFERLPLSRSTQLNSKRLMDEIADPKTTISALCTRLTDLRRDMMVDLTDHLFLMVEEGKGEFYEQSEPPFGIEVAEKFPEAAYDISAASRCVALEEWTACVFHLMRVHEIALRHVGRMLKIAVARKKTIDFQNWQVITEAVVQAAKTAPRGAHQGARAARNREFYNDIALYLSHVKEAWRIPVMHARAKFDKREAMIIWENSKALMYRLAVRKS